MWFRLFHAALSLFIATLSATIGASVSFADSVSQHTLATEKGPLSFTLRRYLNPLHQEEMVVEFDEARAFWKIPVPVLYARDVSGDGKLDGWFIPGEDSTITAIDRTAEEEDGWDVASDLLLNAIHIHEQAYPSFLIQALSSGFTINGMMNRNFLQRISFQEINLGELEIRTNRIAKSEPTLDSDVARQLKFQYEEIAAGWDDVSNQILVYRGRDLPLEIAGDMVLLGGGSWLGEKLGALIEKAGSALLGTSLGKMIESSVGRMSDAISARAAELAEKTGLKKATQPVFALAGEAAAKAEFARLAVKEQIETVLKALSARGTVSRILAQGVRASLKGVGTAAAEGMHQLPALGEAEAIQIATEAFARRKEIFKDGDHPIVVTKDLLSDKDVIQDILFQANAQFWMNGITSYNSGNSFRTKMLLCAAFGFADSTSVNLGIKRDFDPGRNAMDTGWESVAGSLSSWLDMTALGTFEKMAAKSGNPALKLVGYAAIAGIELAENAGYTYLSRWYDEDHVKPSAATSPPADAETERSRLYVVPIWQHQ